MIWSLYGYYDTLKIPRNNEKGDLVGCFVTTDTSRRTPEEHCHSRNKFEHPGTFTLRRPNSFDIGHGGRNGPRINPVERFYANGYV